MVIDPRPLETKGNRFVTVHLRAIESRILIAEGNLRPGRNDLDFCRGYFITMALYLKDSTAPEFLRWYRHSIRDLLALQDVDPGRDRGSWPPVCRWSDFGGRYYTTSLALLVLQTPYRLNP